jgi:hypothetical protein
MSLTLFPSGCVPDRPSLAKEADSHLGYYAVQYKHVRVLSRQMMATFRAHKSDDNSKAIVVQQILFIKRTKKSSILDKFFQ